jgi:hypothetical protein
LIIKKECSPDACCIVLLLRERSQPQKLTAICEDAQLHERSKRGKATEAGSIVVAVRIWGRRDRKQLLNVSRLSFGG